jgi:hypothetical protein
MNTCKSEDMGSGAWKSEPSIYVSRTGRGLDYATLPSRTGLNGTDLRR